MNCLWSAALLALGYVTLPVNCDSLGEKFCHVDTHSMHRLRHNIFAVSKEAQKYDKDTATRLIGKSLFRDLQEVDKCYLLHKVVDFYLGHVLTPEKLQRDYSHIKDVKEAFAIVKLGISKCDAKEPEKANYKFQQLKSQVNKLGKNQVDKVVGELYMLFQEIGKHCSK